MALKPVIMYDTLTPQRMGARDCPNCGPSVLELNIKTIAPGTHFAELICKTCYREAISEVASRNATVIAQAIARWNSVWPDITHYLDTESEGIKSWLTS